jgi:hypothetical protein
MFHSIVREYPSMGIVIIGGLIDSVVGIVNGAVVAVTSAASAVLLPLLPI